jgi:hypothetical protein
MNSDTEGMLLASHCILMALVKNLAESGILKPSQVLDMTSDAEGVLATLSPALMSPEARDYAKSVLQRMGKISSA